MVQQTCILPLRYIQTCLYVMFRCFFCNVCAKTYDCCTLPSVGKTFSKLNYMYHDMLMRINPTSRWYSTRSSYHLFFTYSIVNLLQHLNNFARPLCSHKTRVSGRWLESTTAKCQFAVKTQFGKCYLLPYFWYLLCVFKSCDFCEWIMDRKTILATYTLHNNCIRMLTTKRKSKIAKHFSGGQTHKIALFTDTQNIPKVWYHNILQQIISSSHTQPDTILI